MPLARTFCHLRTTAILVLFVISNCGGGHGLIVLLLRVLSPALYLILGEWTLITVRNATFATLAHLLLKGR